MANTVRAGDLKKGARFVHYGVLVETTTAAQRTHRGYVRAELRPVDPTKKPFELVLNVHATHLVVVLGDSQPTAATP